jgi:hypothetical protein
MTLRRHRADGGPDVRLRKFTASRGLQRGKPRNPARDVGSKGLILAFQIQSAGVSVRDLRSYYFSLVTGLAGTVLLIDDGIGERDRVAHELVVQCGKDARFCGDIEFGCGLRGVGWAGGHGLVNQRSIWSLKTRLSARRDFERLWVPRSGRPTVLARPPGTISKSPPLPGHTLPARGHAAGSRPSSTAALINTCKSVTP